MANLIGIIIPNEESTYHIVGQIGNWGPAFEFHVYSCIEGDAQGQPLNGPTKAIKVLPRQDGGEMMWQTANVEVNNMLDGFIELDLETPVQFFEQQFTAHINGQEYLLIVLANRLNIREILQNTPQFSRGLPMPCIRRAMTSLTMAVTDVHNFGLSHGQITTGQIRITNQNIKCGALSTAFEQDNANMPALPPEFLPPNRISIWGCAPEDDADVLEEQQAAAQPPLQVQEAIDEEEDIIAQVEQWQLFHRQQRDIWSIGVVALELGYGQIPVNNRPQFLQTVSFIRQHGILPQTWGQALENAAAQIAVHPNAARFTGSYIEFLRQCFQPDPNDRPQIGPLATLNFFNQSRMITEEQFLARMPHPE